MPRYFMELAYDGTAYSGWQVQPAAVTVQEEVQRALAMVLHLPELFVVGCGRTDSGVHATQYFLHFDVPEGVPVDLRTLRRLNSLLPEAIAVYRAFPVAVDAHARFSATERCYAYHVHHGTDPFRAGRSHRVHLPLDTDRMNAACRVLLGRHEMTSFCKTGSDVRTMWCDVRVAEWRSVDGAWVFRIAADRFLRNMVRAVVGTALRIGMGRRPVEHMAEVLAAQDRHAAGVAAPACGLYLERVEYPFLPPDAVRIPMHLTA